MLIPGTTQDFFFFFSLLKFPPPEFTVSALIFISPQKKNTNSTPAALPALAVCPGVTVGEECAAVLSLDYLKTDILCSLPCSPDGSSSAAPQMCCRNRVGAVPQLLGCSHCSLEDDGSVRFGTDKII